MSRPSKDSVFLEVARTIGQLGTCDRARVGAVLTRGGRAISWGFNGAPPGAPHCDDNYHGWQGYYDLHAHLPDIMLRLGDKLVTHGCRNSVHAEANAIAFAARQGISTDGATLYVERTPCLNCAHLCIAAGIVAVNCATTYRDRGGEEILRQCGIPVYYISEVDHAPHA